MNENEKQQAIEVLNRIMELELSGVVRYTHYALMVFWVQPDTGSFLA